MKTLIITFFLLSFSLNSDAQISFGFPGLGLEYDITKDFSIKGGYGLATTDGSNGLYSQLYSKYNFTNKAIGGQVAIGYTRFIGDDSILPLGGRFGLDYEYSFKFEQNEFSLFLLAGFDFLGVGSLVLGPKLNLSKNIDQRTWRFNITVDIPIILLFQNSRQREALKEVL